MLHYSLTWALDRLVHAGSRGVVPQDAGQGTGGSEPHYRSPHKPQQGFSAHQAT